MTNPAPAPQQPVTTPAPELSAREFFQQDDGPLAAALGIAAPEATDLEEVPEAPGVEAPAKPLTKEATEVPKEEPEAPAEDVVQIPPVQRKPMTEFKVMDVEGELEIPDIQIEFKAKGEVRKLPLDHVVRLAQFGFANEEREQQVLAAKHFVQESEQREQSYQTQIQQYETYYAQLFNDPAFYEEARLNFLNQHTPEARALRAEQELQRERAQKQQEQEHNYLAGFVQQTLEPMVSRLVAENPLVSVDEVVGRYTKPTAPLLRNGRVPLNRLSDVEAVVKGDLANWVQQTQYERDLVKKQADQQAAQKTQQVAAAKRQTGRVFAQLGTVPEPQTKPTKFDSARSWLDATLPSPSE